MRPIEVLMHLRTAWLQEPPPHHELTATLQVCPACEDGLLHDLDSLFVPVEGLHSRRLDASQVMGFTFRQGTPETCAMHAFLREERVCP